ncbi:PAS domain-containing protein [Thermus sediminis]|uniref:PAS domain-containing protein n=1 Tax=Thermus sediminis TaxID=1761908 RepID=UPI000E3C72D9|nr:PAS domain-containing protein [Thermus sediminis]
MVQPLLPTYLLQAVLDQLAESVLMTNVEGRILYVNAVFEALTGYGREEVLGKNPRILKSLWRPRGWRRGSRRFWGKVFG